MTNLEYLQGASIDEITRMLMRIPKRNDCQSCQACIEYEEYATGKSLNPCERKIKRWLSEEREADA